MNFTREQHESFILPKLLEWFGLDNNPKYLTDVVEELENFIVKNQSEVTLALHLFVRTLKTNITQELSILRSMNK